MPFVSEGALTPTNTKTSGTSMPVTLPSNVAAGRLICAQFTYDNTTGTTPAITSIAKPAGETNSWVRAHNINSPSTGATAGQRTEFWYIWTTTTWTAGSYAGTLDGSVPSRVTLGLVYSGLAGTVRSPTGTLSNSTTGTATSASYGGAVSVGDLLVAVVGTEAPTVPTFSVTPLSASTSSNTTGGSSATNVAAGMFAFGLTSASGSVTGTGTADTSIGIVIFSQAAAENYTGSVALSGAGALAASGKLLYPGYQVPWSALPPGDTVYPGPRPAENYTRTVALTGAGTLTVAAAIGRKENTAETGLADGTVVSTTNSDDGTAGYPLAATLGNAFTYSTTSPMRGSLSYRLAITDTGSSSRYIRFGIGTPAPTLAIRFYLTMEQFPSSNFMFGRFLNSLSGRMVGLRANTDNTLTLLNNGSGVLSTTPVLTVGSWYRVEIWVTPNSTSTTGRWGWAVYNGHDTSTPLVTGSGSTANLGFNPTPRTFEWGKSTTPDVPIAFRIDDLAIDDTIGESFIGPSEIIVPTGTVDLSGSGTLTVTGATEGYTGSVGLSGSGSLTVTGTPAATGTVVTTGSGTLGLTGTPAVPGTVLLTGAGTLALTGTVAAVRSLPLSGSGTLTVTGVPAPRATVALSGSGTMSAVGVSGTGGVAQLTGAGTLAVTGGPISITRTVPLSGSGTLTTPAVVGLPGSAGFTGSGTLTPTGSPRLVGAAAASGSGTLTVAGVVKAVGTVGLTGSGTLSAVGVYGVGGVAQLSGSGTLTLTRGALQLTQTVPLSGTGSLAPAGTPATSAGCSLTGSGTLTLAAQAGGPRSTDYLIGKVEVAPGDLLVPLHGFTPAPAGGEGTLTIVGVAAFPEPAEPSSVGGVGF